MNDQVNFSPKISYKKKKEENKCRSYTNKSNLYASNSIETNQNLQKNNLQIVCGQRLPQTVKNNEISSELEKPIASNRNKHDLQISKMKNTAEKLHKIKISSCKTFVSNERKSDTDCIQSSNSTGVITRELNIPEVMVNCNQLKKEHQISNAMVISQKQNHNTIDKCVQHNINTDYTNVNFPSGVLSETVNVIDQSYYHIGNLKEEKNDNSEKIYKNKSIVNELEHKNIQYFKTREEIIEQRRIKVAARKKEKKLATKRQKEEEYLRKTTASKYKGVMLINNQEQVKESWKVPKEIVNVPELSEFPCLGSTSKKKHQQIFVDEIPQKVIRKGKPKKMDPISISIFDAINSKKLEQKPAVPVTKSRLNNPVISGNNLDSDNPQRKRGKVRLGKKAKPSRLKAHILKVRQEKLNTRNCATTTFDETKKINLTFEEAINYKYLLNLTSFKHPESLESVEDDNSGIKSSTQLEPDKHIAHVIHTKQFREYCDNTLTPQLVESVCNLLTTIVKFQDRLYAKDPIKAHAKRRYVIGLREAEKYLKLGKVKLLVIAPDLEKIPGEHGLDTIILRLKEEAQRKFVPYVFGPKRNKLGYCTFKKQKISAVAILKYEGAETKFTEVISLLNEARVKYKELVEGSNSQSEHGVKEGNTEANTDRNKELQSEIISSFLEKLRLTDEESLHFGT